MFNSDLEFVLKHLLTTNSYTPYLFSHFTFVPRKYKFYYNYVYLLNKYNY